MLGKGGGDFELFSGVAVQNDDKQFKKGLEKDPKSATKKSL